MSKEFLSRNQRQNSESNQQNTSQKKIDPVAQLKWLNNLPIDHGFGIFGDNQPAQMFAKEEDEQIQRKAKEEELQMKSSSAQNQAESQSNSGTQTSMPDSVQAKMESSFGVDFSGVNIHQNSGQAKNMGALAYTQGNDVHFASGQYNPGNQKGQELLGHELTHVIQQRQGRVQPTNTTSAQASGGKQSKGLPINDNPSLEKEADVMGAKAAQGKAVSKYKLTRGIRNASNASQMKNGIIQRAVNTSGGTWDTDQYDLRKDKDSRGNVYPSSAGARGVDMKLKFTPNSTVDAELIGLTQSVQGFVNNSLKLTPAAATRNISQSDAISINTGSGETDEGTAIDRASGYNNPIYAVKSKPSLSLNDTNTSTNWGQHGWNSSNKTPNKKAATLIDKPTRGGATKNSRHIFETTALATKGTQASTYYGSVRWGWRTDNAGNFTKISLQKVSHGVPSSTFMKAAQIWNSKQGVVNANNISLPIKDVKLISNIAGVNIGSSPVHLPFGTRVIKIPGATSSTESFIKVVDGSFTGKTGKVQLSNLTDERN